MEPEELSGASGSTKFTIGVYPEPLVVQPKSKEHHQTIIILHGRGSNGIKFGLPLLETCLGDTKETLADRFPHAKFIFPTAAPRRAKIYRRIPIFQWMDNWSLDRPLDQQELQVPGLQASTAYIHQMLQKEIENVGVQNVLLGGLSQGCACTLVSLLTWKGPNLPASFGICGWLPFAKTMVDAVDNTEDGFDGDDGEDPFQSEDQEQQDEVQRMISAIHETLDLAYEPSMSTLACPIFLGHGALDQKVPIERGRTAAQTLRRINAAEVKWMEYPDLGHWYSSTMLEDVVAFIKANTSWS